MIVADTLRDPRTLGSQGPTLMPFLNESCHPGYACLPRLLASSSWTAPSHVSLLSGTDPWETHFHMPGQGRRPPMNESIADKWRKAGGVSAAFSANFLVAPQVGTATGYDRFNPVPAVPAGVAQLIVTQFGYERLLYRAMTTGGEASSGALSRAWDSMARVSGTALYKSINSMRSGETIRRPCAATYGPVGAVRPLCTSSSTSPRPTSRTSSVRTGAPPVPGPRRSHPEHQLGPVQRPPRPPEPPHSVRGGVRRLPPVGRRSVRPGRWTSSNGRASSRTPSWRS